MNHGGWVKGLMVVGLCVAAVGTSAALRAPAEQSKPSLASPTAVGVINLKKLFDNLTEYKDSTGLIEEKQKDVEKKIKEVEGQIEKLSKDFEALKDPPMAVRLDFQVKLVELQALRDARIAALRRSLEVQAGDVMRRMFIKAVETGDRLALKDGWDIILIDDRGVVPPEKVDTETSKEGRRITASEVRSIIQQRTIFTANDARVDVTAALYEMMNNEYKAGKR